MCVRRDTFARCGKGKSIMKTLRVLVCSLLLTAGSTLLAGCPGMDGETYAPGSSAATPTPTPILQPISLALSTDKPLYESGETVRFIMTLRNETAETKTLDFNSGQVFDIVVATKTASAEPEFQWSRGRLFTQALRNETLAAGESKTYNAAWNGKNARGQFVMGQFDASATLKTRDGIQSPTVSFGITPKKAMPTPNVTPTPNATPKLQFSLATNKTIYKKGEAIKFTMTLKNTTRQTQSYQYNGGQSFDVDVLTTDGRLLWRWSQGQFFTMMIRGRMLPAGESEVFKETWNAKKADGKTLAPGTYRVRARLTANGIKPSEKIIIVK